MVPASHFSEGHIAVAAGVVEAARTAYPHSSPEQMVAAAGKSALDTRCPAQDKQRSLEAPAVAVQFPSHQPLLEAADTETGTFVEALYRPERPGQDTAAVAAAAAVDIAGAVELDCVSSDSSTRLWPPQ